MGESLEHLRSTCISSHYAIVVGDGTGSVVRIHAPGMLGLSVRGEAFGDDDTGEMMDEIALYKAVRELLFDASLRMRRPQSGAEDADGWDVVEALSAATGDVVVFAFATGSAAIRPLAMGPGRSTMKARLRLDT